MSNDSALFRPLQIGSVTVKNRLLMAPMDTGFGNNAWGGFTPEGVEYFVRRAQGGWGLLFSGGTATDRMVDGADTLLNHPEEFLRVGRELNRRIEKYGCKMFLQLSFNVGRNAGLKTPSPLPTLGNPKVMTEALTVEEIHTKVREMGEAAKLVRDAGFAGVDIHALHWGHLLDSFALSFMNHREDAYGGSLENRLRVCQEIREAIAEACGGDFPVTIRLALKSYMKGFNRASFDGSGEVGRSPEKAVEIAKLLESYGYDGLSTDAGTLDAFYYAEPPCYVPVAFTLDMAERVKRAVSIPVLCGGRMADPDIDERAIAEGKIDAVVIGRQAIADPDFPNKLLAGKPEQVRPCIGCNQGCIWGYSTTGKVGCAVNTEVGREGVPVPEAAKKKKIAIVGGGVAGMEAARLATLRGHTVTLYEKTGKLGGNLIPAGAHDFKTEVAALNEYFKQEMERLNIDLRLNTEATTEKLKASGADVILLALGSVPVMPRSIPGINHPKAVSGADALLGRKPVGNIVVVAGGGLVGCEIAFGYVKEGKAVTIVEALDGLMKGDVPNMNRTMLLDAFAHYGVRVLTSTTLSAITDAGAVVQGADGAEETIPADTVVLSLGYRPVHSLAAELADCGAQVFEIGDGRQVANVLTAIRDADEAVEKI